jgi:hypothetical protein
MEKPEELKLTLQRAFYILKHFESIDADSRNLFLKMGYSELEISKAIATIGSKFFNTFCSNPLHLSKIINNSNPVESISQSNGNSIFIYSFHESGGIGNDNLINVNNLLPFELKYLKVEKRNNFKIKIVEKEGFVKTNELVVVASKENNEIITAFPGQYAPPFPIHLSEPKSKIASERFWEEHAFIEINK